MSKELVISEEVAAEELNPNSIAEPAQNLEANEAVPAQNGEMENKAMVEPVQEVATNGMVEPSQDVVTESGDLPNSAAKVLVLPKSETTNEKLAKAELDTASKHRGVKILLPSSESDAESEVPARKVPSIHTIQPIQSFEAIQHIHEFSDSESMIGSIQSAGSYAQQKPLVIGPDFFETFDELPDINDISDRDSSEEEEIIIFPPLAERIKSLEIRDEGHFVNSVTGMPSTTSIVDAPPEIIEEVEEEEEVVEEELRTSDEDDELLNVPEIAEVNVDTTLDEDAMFTAFLDAEAQHKSVCMEEFDWDNYKREQEALYIHSTTVEFLNALINLVVDDCEYVDPNTVLRRQLDKLKIMTELQAKLNDWDIELKSRLFLNRKVVEYYRRRKEYRPISSTNLEEADLVKFNEALQHLEYVLGREATTFAIRSARMAELEVEHTDLVAHSKLSEAKLEDAICKAMDREHFTKLKASVGSQLQYMAKVREEISQIRSIVISRQHTLASILNKSDELEVIGECLYMKDFERLYADIYNLGKKVEERNTELTKLRRRCNADTHIMAHLKEKYIMRKDSIETQKLVLADLDWQKKQCREYNVSQKILRGKIRREIRDVSFQGGLLDKPTLMLDYDETDDILQKLREDVEQKRKQMNDILGKIQILEEKYKL